MNWDGDAAGRNELRPTPYHLAVAEQLRRLEPASWSALAAAAAQPAEQVHGELLRSACRLDPVGHPEVHRAVARAAGQLGLTVPVSVWRLEADPTPNATLLHLPGEAVIAFSGGLLGLLGPDELTAVIGHELTHHLLWTWQDGRLLVADRLLDALLPDARTPPAYLETARRWSLATEVAADRGALLACGDLRVTVAALVKTATGRQAVDADSYLGQAAALDPVEAGRAGRSHPETVLRAGALAQWEQSGQDGDRALAALLDTGLDLDRLDLLDREYLEDLTRSTVQAMLAGLAAAGPQSASDPVLAHARLFFPDLVGAPAAADTVRLPEQATAATRRYLSYVLLDLATVDPDLEQAGVEAARRLAAAAGFAEVFDEVLGTERIGPVGTR